MFCLRDLRESTKSIVASIARSCRRRRKYKYQCRVWQLDDDIDGDTLPDDDNFMHASDDLRFHFRVCCVSLDVLDNSPNPDQVHQVVREFKRKLFGSEFHLGRSNRRVPKRHQNTCLDNIAFYVRRTIASVEQPRTVQIGVSFGIIKLSRRQPFYSNGEEEDEEEGEEEENGGFRGVGASTESIEALEVVRLESCMVGSVGCCMVCLEEFWDFSGAVELSRMPCQHVYHKDCIVRWLEMNHLCPLCRFPMPPRTS